MFEKVMYLASLTLYTILSAVLLAFFNAPLLFTLFILSVLPLILLIKNARVHALPLVALSVLTVAVTLVFEIIAYENGIWYEIGDLDWLVFGMFPPEAFVAGLVHMLYFVVVYEYFFDDKSIAATVPGLAWRVFGTTALVLCALGLSYLYVFSHVLLTNAFALLVSACVVFLLFGALLVRKLPLHLIQKAALFALSIFPVSLAYEYVAQSNNLRFFANTNEYIFVINFFGYPVPIEELFFVLIIPFVLAIVYELYLDDGR